MKPEIAGARPKLLPGDILQTKENALVVIVKAQTAVNGGSYDWNDNFPRKSKFKHGHPPCYSVDILPNSPNKGVKNAWWTMDEFDYLVKLGPLHSYRS